MKNYKSVDESIKHVIDQASKSVKMPEKVVLDKSEKMTKPIPEGKSIFFYRISYFL